MVLLGGINQSLFRDLGHRLENTDEGSYRGLSAPVDLFHKEKEKKKKKEICQPKG